MTIYPPSASKNEQLPYAVIVRTLEVLRVLQDDLLRHPVKKCCAVLTESVFYPPEKALKKLTLQVTRPSVDATGMAMRVGGKKLPAVAVLGVSPVNMPHQFGKRVAIGENLLLANRADLYSRYYPS